MSQISTRFRHFSFLLGIIVLMLLEGCRKTDIGPIPQPSADNFSAKIAVDWMEQTRQLVKSEGKNPPQASRIYAYAAIAIYESVLPGMSGYQSISNQIPGLVNLPDERGFGKMDYTLAVNEAMYQLNLKVFGSLQANNIHGLELLHKKYFDEKVRSVSNEIIQNSVEFGKMVALAVLNRANNDNFSETRSMTYMVPSWISNASYWAPTDNNNLTPVEPFWGKVKCFAMTSSAECEIPASVDFNSTVNSDFYNQALEVYTVSQNLTQEEKNIALWWADGGGTATPPGHWVAIQNDLVTKLNLGIGKAAEMYALVNIGMADAFISCWDAKYKFNLLRPQTYIRNYISNASSWKPVITTPPFPEYPSGHSVSSGVAAEILTSLFGTVSFTDNTNTGLGLAPRSYKSFNEAADEAAISRLYGGIHYREACDNGVQQGHLVAKSVMKNIRLNN